MLAGFCGDIKALLGCVWHQHHWCWDIASIIPKTSTHLTSHPFILL
jgi:hypothetical protein